MTHNTGLIGAIAIFGAWMLMLAFAIGRANVRITALEKRAAEERRSGSATLIQSIPNECAVEHIQISNIWFANAESEAKFWAEHGGGKDAR